MKLGKKVFCDTRLKTGSVLLFTMLSAQKSAHTNSGFFGLAGNLTSTIPHSFTPEMVLGS